MTRFDRIAVVDWSASSAPPKKSPQADAIWIGQANARGVVTTYHSSRHMAEQAIVALIAQTRAAGESLLIGVDFALGYPAGFAPRLTGQAQARAVWRWLAAQITDSPANLNNRFAVADAMASRAPSSHALAVERMRQHGVAVVNTEMVVFELLGRAGTAEFKALSSLVR